MEIGTSVVGGRVAVVRLGGRLHNEQVGTMPQLTDLDRVLRPFESVEAASDGW